MANHVVSDHDHYTQGRLVSCELSQLLLAKLNQTNAAYTGRFSHTHDFVALLTRQSYHVRAEFVLTDGTVLSRQKFHPRSTMRLMVERGWNFSRVEDRSRRDRRGSFRPGRVDDMMIRM